MREAGRRPSKNVNDVPNSNLAYKHTGREILEKRRYIKGLFLPAKEWQPYVDIYSYECSNQ